MNTQGINTYLYSYTWVNNMAPKPMNKRYQNKYMLFENRIGYYTVTV